MEQIVLDIKNKCVIAAISGGPDSMCLINILLELIEKLNYKIVVAHVHHNLRKESENEAEFVKNYCDQNDIKFANLHGIHLQEQKWDCYIAVNTHSSGKSPCKRCFTRTQITKHSNN